ncbi:IS630 family transposase, partial [archaeon SCG-AAA382B04]
MPGEYIKDVERWISKKELVDLIKEKKIEAKLLERLYFIKFLYEGDNVPEASDKVEISDQTGYRWRKKWNKEGVEGLEPEYDGGPKPKLKEKEKEELKEKLKERDNWTTSEIKNLNN